MFSNSQSDFLSFFDVSVKAALDDSCPKKSKRRLGFPYYYFSHSIHLANKLRTLRRKKFSILSYMTRLESDFITSVVLDKEVLFQNFSLSCAFKFLKHFKKSPINANNLHWGRKQAVCDVSISDFFNENFASVFRKPVSDYTVSTVSPDSDIKLSEVDVSPSVHIYNPLKIPALLTVFLLLFINFVRSYFLLLVFFFTLSTLASGLLPGNVLLLLQF